MKTKVFLTFMLAVITGLAACKFFQNSKTSEQEEANFEMIDSADVFEYSVVRDFKPTLLAQTHARKLYFKAVEQCVNKKDARGSLSVFLQSLRIAPNHETYMKYGDALFAVDSFESARLSYIQASYLDKQLEGPASYGIARCFAMMGNTQSAIYNLESALELFPYEIEQLDKDAAFDAIRDLDVFKILIVKHVGNDEQRKVKLLNLFASNFPEVSAPFEIVDDSLLSAGGGNSIDYRYADFIPALEEAEFSREVGKDFQFIAQLSLQPDFKTLLYRAVDILGDTMNPVFYHAINIDSSGVVLDDMEIACFCSPLTLKKAVVSASGDIEIREVVQTWKDDPIYNGYAGNEVLKQEVKSVISFQITPNGKFAKNEGKNADVEQSATANSAP